MSSCWLRECSEERCEEHQRSPVLLRLQVLVLSMLPYSLLFLFVFVFVFVYSPSVIHLLLNTNRLIASNATVKLMHQLHVPWYTFSLLPLCPYHTLSHRTLLVLFLFITYQLDCMICYSSAPFFSPSCLLPLALVLTLTQMVSWLKKCKDDSETSNWISANTKDCMCLCFLLFINACHLSCYLCFIVNCFNRYEVQISYREEWWLVCFFFFFLIYFQILIFNTSTTLLYYIGLKKF